MPLSISEVISAGAANKMPTPTNMNGDTNNQRMAALNILREPVARPSNRGSSIQMPTLTKQPQAPAEQAYLPGRFGKAISTDRSDDGYRARLIRNAQNQGNNTSQLGQMLETGLRLDGKPMTPREYQLTQQRYNHQQETAGIADSLLSKGPLQQQAIRATGLINQENQRRLLANRESYLRSTGGKTTDQLNAEQDAATAARQQRWANHIANGRGGLTDKAVPVADQRTRNIPQEIRQMAQNITPLRENDINLPQQFRGAGGYKGNVTNYNPVQGNSYFHPSSEWGMMNNRNPNPAPINERGAGLWGRFENRNYPLTAGKSPEQIQSESTARQQRIQQYEQRNPELVQPRIQKYQPETFGNRLQQNYNFT